MSEPKIDKRSKEYRDLQKEKNSTHNADTYQPIEIESQNDQHNLSALDTESIQEIRVQEVQTIIQEPNIKNMSVDTVLEAPKVKKVKGIISIRPYVPVDEQRPEKMGLDEQKEALFPGTYQIDHIGMGTRNGFKTYITGLDENVTEIQLLATEAKHAKIRSIRETVAFLENTIANNFTVTADSCMDGYGTKEDSFWRSVTMFNSTGPDKFDAKGNRIETYWDKVELKLENKGRDLNLNDPHDLVIYNAIEAGGLSLVAPSLQIAMEKPVYNFYLDQPSETSAIKTEFKKLKGKASGYLNEMLDKNQNKLFLMAKLAAPVNSAEYRRGGVSYTPMDQIYDDLFDYIEGKRGDDSKLAVHRFLEFYDMSTDDLIRRAIVKDATELHLIEPKGDGQLYYTNKNARLGKTIEDIVEHLKNKLNIEVWESLKEKVENYWAS